MMSRSKISLTLHWPPLSARFLQIRNNGGEYEQEDEY
jgi:hypothetical protein